MLPQNPQPNLPHNSPRIHRPLPLRNRPKPAQHLPRHRARHVVRVREGVRERFDGRGGGLEVMRDELVQDEFEEAEEVGGGDGAEVACEGR